MTDVLILGGTGWLSGRIARRWQDAGAAVTVLARGARDAPSGTRLVRADRGRDDAYAAVADREWDEVVDISSSAAHVRGATAALAERTRHGTYVSSVSAYATDDTAGADESAPSRRPPSRATRTTTDARRPPPSRPCGRRSATARPWCARA